MTRPPRIYPGASPASRRTVLQAIAAGAGAALLASCSKNGKSATSAAGCVDKLDFNVKAPDKHPGMLVSKVKGIPLAWTEYPKPYKSVSKVPGSGGTVTTFQILYGAPPTAQSKNPWWQQLNKRLGVTIAPNLAPSDSYAAKLNTLAASGKFPDITYINFAAGVGANAFEKTVSQGAFHDLTPYLTGKGLEDYPNLQLFPEWVWKGTAFQGKLFGVPRPVQPVNGVLTLYRRDWAQKVGVDDPKNADEVFKFASTLAKGSKSKNAWLTAGFGQNQWNQMYGVPNGWRQDKDGKLTAAIETDEYEEALKFAVKLWKTGALYPEAATVTFQQSLDLFNSGRVAMFGQGFVPMMGMIGKSSDLHKADPKADIAPFFPPGHDGGDPVLSLSNGIWGFGAIPSSIKDEDQIKELIRIMDYYSAPYGSEEYTFMNYGIEGRQFKFDKNGVPVSLNNAKAANDMTLNYLSETSEINFFYPEDPGLAKLAQDTQAKAMQLAVADPTMGLYSPTQVSKGSSLDKMNTDFYNGIVMGRKSIDELDDWRSQWKSRGGDQIRHEYEEALTKCQA